MTIDHRVFTLIHYDDPLLLLTMSILTISPLHIFLLSFESSFRSDTSFGNTISEGVEASLSSCQDHEARLLLSVARRASIACPSSRLGRQRNELRSSGPASTIGIGSQRSGGTSTTLFTSLFTRRRTSSSVKLMEWTPPRRFYPTSINSTRTS